MLSFVKAVFLGFANQPLGQTGKYLQDALGTLILFALFPMPLRRNGKWTMQFTSCLTIFVMFVISQSRWLNRELNFSTIQGDWLLSLQSHN